MRARFWFVALVAAIVLLPATEAAAHTSHRRKVAAFMGPVSVAKAAGVGIVHAKRTTKFRAKAADLITIAGGPSGFACGVYVGTATGNNPKVASTTTSTDDIDYDTDTDGYYDVTDCSGSLAPSATDPDSAMTLTYTDCYTYAESVAPAAFIGPGTGSVTVDPDGSYTGSCSAPISPEEFGG